MLNQLVVVGRLSKEPIKVDGGVIITLAVPRYYKNKDGIYDTDFISVRLFRNIAESTLEYCKQGDLVGIKGHIECLSDEPLFLVADKVTFLSSKKED